MPVSTQARVVDAVVRGAMYGLLARIFVYPEDAHRETMMAHAVHLHDLPDALAGQVADLIATMPEGEQAEAAFIRVFTHSSSRDCPPLETSYTAHDVFQQTQQLADLAGFYQAFGVVVAPAMERVDHISTELEFASFLASKQGYAAEHLSASRVRQCRHAERLFLRDHLGCWAGAFGRRVAAVDPDGWFGRAGRLLDAWITAECAALRVTPAELQEAPRLVVEPPDETQWGPDDDLKAEEIEPITWPGSRGGRIPLPLVESRG